MQTTKIRDKPCGGENCKNLIQRRNERCKECHLKVARARSLEVVRLGERSLTEAEKQRRYRLSGRFSIVRQAWRKRKAAERDRKRLKFLELTSFDVRKFYPPEYENSNWWAQPRKPVSSQAEGIFRSEP